MLIERGKALLIMRLEWKRSGQTRIPNHFLDPLNRDPSVGIVKRGFEVLTGHDKNVTLPSPLRKDEVTQE
jgi:hypothetical protein